MTGDLTWADAPLDVRKPLGEIFCLTYLKDVDETEALLRMGGLPDTFATRTPRDYVAAHHFDHGYPDMASALRMGDWTLLVEPRGWQGANLTRTLSLGTAAVSVLRHDHACHAFEYAVDGELVLGFDPFFGASRYGTEPDLLLPAMRELAFATTEAEEEDDDWDGTIARSLLLAERLTGVLPDHDTITGPLLSAHVEPWFSAAPPERPDGDAIAEVRALAARHGLTGTPGLADALAAAERGTAVTVTPESPLGMAVRGWLTEGRRASWSLNDHSGSMTPDERARAHELTGLAKALGAALRP